MLDTCHPALGSEQLRVAKYFIESHEAAQTHTHTLSLSLSLSLSQVASSQPTPNAPCCTPVRSTCTQTRTAFWSGVPQQAHQEASGSSAVSASIVDLSKKKLKSSSCAISGSISNILGVRDRMYNIGVSTRYVYRVWPAHSPHTLIDRALRI